MIKVLKLKTGEEIVGDIVEKNGEITVKKPCYIQLVPSRQDPSQPAMALMPCAAYTKDHKVTIDVSSVIWVEEPITDLYNNYNQLYGSGLVVPNM